MEKFLLLSEGEIALKGHNRRYFENVLIANISEYLRRCNISLKREKRGRLIINIDESVNIEAIIDGLSTIPGLKTIYYGYKIERNFDAAVNVVLQLLDTAKSFKIQASRVDKHFSINSMEINKLLGQKVLESVTSLIVDVKNPERTVFLEVFSDHFKVFTKVKNTIGGLPYGVSGKAICLLSTGVDSPVAAFMMAKRGLEIIPLYFHVPPYIGNVSLEKVRNLVKCLINITIKPIKLYIVNFTKIQLLIKNNISDKYWTIVSRRFMGRIAQDIAAIEEAKAIVTGESVGQVASQTLFNIVAINEVFLMPVFRPLIGMDKDEIIKIAQRIGTFNVSTGPGIDCCTLFSPKHPETKAKVHEFIDSEKEILEHLKDNYSYEFVVVE